MIRPPAATAADGREGATIDLHLHSTASDGMLPPGAVVAAARTAGLSAIALTDHDTVDGLPEARAAAESAGIRFVAGIELSAEHDGIEVHVLGLHLADPVGLAGRLAVLRTERVERARAIVARLGELGIAISFESVLANAAGGSVGRPHVARALIEAGAVRDFREAFDRYLGAGRPGFVPKRMLSPAEAVAMIHSAGGLAVWAHPGTHASEQFVAFLAAAGLDGLEVLHPSHGPETVQRLQAVCETRSLVPSGGSDWHATPGVSRTLGAQAVPAEWLERHDAALAMRHGRAATGAR